MSVTQEEVDEALDNAEVNEYAPSQWVANKLALDLMEYSATFEKCEVEELLPLVLDWQRRHPPIEGAPRRDPFT